MFVLINCILIGPEDGFPKTMPNSVVPGGWGGGELF